MPIRTIKPDFWTDEKMVELSFQARLLFIGLWNFVDNCGRIPYSPRSIKMKIFPGDAFDITPILTELHRSRVVEIYEIENKQYLQVVNWSKHQKVDPRYESKLPPPPDKNEDTTPNPKGKQRLNGNGNGKGGHRFTPPSLDDVREFCRERGVDPDKWYNFYQSKGWMVGKNKMKDWKACVRTWEKKRDDEVIE